MTEILIPEFVEFMPEEKEEGILYISEKFSLAMIFSYIRNLSKKDHIHSK